MKRIIAAITLLLTLFTLTACEFKNAARDRAKVFQIVTENEALLRECVASRDFSAAQEIEGIERIYVDWDNVDFSCGGYGFGSNTSYYGFCYVKDNDWRKITYAEYVMLEDTIVEGNRMTYKQPDGDNTWVAEKIVDGFWYYDAAF